jgi:hypothetical protein
MNKYLTLSTSAALLSGLFLITGCSSSGDDGGTPSATVPANAILINDSATAEATLISAVSTGNSIVSAFGVETSNPLTARDVINVVLDKFKSGGQNSSSIATGVDLSDQICISGTASGDETETDTSYNASITFNECDIGSGLIFTGSLSISSTWTASGTYSDNASGNLTVTFTADNSSVGFNGLSYAENGNESTGDYTITKFTYVIDPSAGGGFLTQLTQPLVGNTYVSCELSSGQVLVTGAAGSQARATVNSDGSAKMEYHSGDGNFIETDNSPLACLT